MTALTTSSGETEGIARAQPPTYARTALTLSDGHSQRRCANPFCESVVESKSPRAKHGRYCSDRCRMDGYALRRAKAMLDKVGIIEFHRLLEQT